MPYKKGDIVEGIITNVVNYGAFVHVDASTTGLIHISEITHGFVDDIYRYVAVGERVNLKVVDVDEQKQQLKLSLKGAPRNYKTYRKRRSRILTQKKDLVPKSKIGFESLEQKMPEWIKEQIKHDKT